MQNLFVIESLYRQQGDKQSEELELPSSPEIFSVTSSLAPPYNGIINRAYETPDKACVTMESEQEENGQVYGCPRKPSEVPLPVGKKEVDSPNVKRQILKNLSVFLIMCNISVSIIIILYYIPIKRIYIHLFTKNSHFVTHILAMLNADPILAHNKTVF